MRRRVILGVAIVAVAVGLAALVAMLARPSTEPVTVAASSTMAGTDVSALVRSAADAAAPAGDAVWRSAAETDGSWVSLTWEEPTTVSRVRIDDANDPSGAYANALLTFSDGSSVLLTPDEDGDVLVDIPRRVVRSATVRFGEFPAEASSVALNAIVIDDDGQHIEEPRASSITGAPHGTDPRAVVDGDIASGTLGAAWWPQDDADWVAHEWDAPVTLASVQLAGVSQPMEPGGGTLVFSDGSRVLVAGVGSGNHPVSTVAFAPRTVTSVRFEPEHPGVAVGEFRAYGPGTTPPQWPSEGTYEVEAPLGSCEPGADAIGEPQDSALALVCPQTGAQVGPEATIVVSGPAGQKASASAWTPIGDSGSLSTIADAVFDDDGRASLVFPTDQLPHGPLAVKITVPGSPVPLYVQLFNQVGKDPVVDDHAPPGKTLQYEDTFDLPLSISITGSDAVYAAAKPEGSGTGEFGEAVFLDPARGRDLLATMGGMLRIRAEPFDGEDPREWDRTSASGIVSSMHVGGSGFSAQYGYFEARILAPAGRGSWPAFWMLDANSAVRPEEPSSEVDAIELYGHNTLGACHAIHNWPVEDLEGTGATCLDRNGHGDWALEWKTYAVDVRPNGADFFIDGVQVATRENLLRDSTPYYFMLNLALGGGWPIMIDPTGGTLDMYVDWVRAYT